MPTMSCKQEFDFKNKLRLQATLCKYQRNYFLLNFQASCSDFYGFERRNRLMRLFMINNSIVIHIPNFIIYISLNSEPKKIVKTYQIFQYIHQSNIHPNQSFYRSCIKFSFILDPKLSLPLVNQNNFFPEDKSKIKHFTSRNATLTIKAVISLTSNLWFLVDVHYFLKHGLAKR